YHRHVPMNDDAILSISAPYVGRRRLVVTPAPVLELTYAYYFLMRRLGSGRDSELPWVKQLRENPPPGMESLDRAWQETESSAVGTELLLMACSLGYAPDGTPQRFLNDLPGLPARAIEGLEQLMDDPDADADEHDARYARLEAQLQRLSQPGVVDTV